MMVVKSVLHAGNGLTMIQVEEDLDAQPLMDFIHPHSTSVAAKRAAAAKAKAEAAAAAKADREAAEMAEAKAAAADRAKAEAKAAAGASARTNTTNEVSFRDTSRDRIKFKIENDGSMTYYVNGRVKVHHLTKLETRTNHNLSVTISLNGTSGGSWSPLRSTTVPSPGRATSDAILSLFRRRRI